MTMSIGDWYDPEAEREAWTDVEWEGYVKEIAVGRAVELFIEIGLRLRLAHDHFKARPQQWGRRWDVWCKEVLGFSAQTVSYREIIAENLSRSPLEVRQALPDSPHTLYLLASWKAKHEEEFAAAIADGRITPSMTEKHAKNLTARTARAARDKRNAALEAELAGGDWKLDQCDFRDWQVSGIDLVLTDPPYADEHLDLYEDLPVCADEWLKPEGWLGVMVGQAHLPRVLHALAGGPLRYAWTFCLKASSGRVNGIQSLHVQNAWKPLILLRKASSKAPLKEWTLDHIDYEWQAKDGDHHRWQQDVSPFQKLIRAMTAPGAMVADPFCGSGTTGVAAISTSRRFFGCDREALSIKSASSRLLQAEANAKLPDGVAAIRSA